MGSPEDSSESSGEERPSEPSSDEKAPSENTVPNCKGSSGSSSDGEAQKNPPAVPPRNQSEAADPESVVEDGAEGGDAEGDGDASSGDFSDMDKDPASPRNVAESESTSTSTPIKMKKKLRPTQSVPNLVDPGSDSSSSSDDDRAYVPPSLPQTNASADSLDILADQDTLPQPTFIGVLPGESPDASIKRIGDELTKAINRIAQLEVQARDLKRAKAKYKSIAKKHSQAAHRSQGRRKPRPGPVRGASVPHGMVGSPSGFGGGHSRKRSESASIENEFEQFLDEEELDMDAQTSALVIKNATPRQLVNRLAGVKPIDGAYVRDFVVVYAHFMETDVLLKKLIERYQFLPPDDSDEKAEYFDQWRGPVQMRVINIFRKWVETNPRELAVGSDPQKFERTKAAWEQFKQLLVDSEKESWAERLQETLETRLELNSIVDVRVPKPEELTVPIIPHQKGKKKDVSAELESLDDLEPLECARQLTLFEWNLFSLVSPNELRSGLWEKEKTKHLCPGVLGVTSWFNRLCNWIVTDIIVKRELKERVKALQRWIKIGEICLEIGNFHLVCEVVAALNRSPIARLKATWAQVPKRSQKSFAEMTEIMGGGRNYREYRLRLSSAGRPVLPYLGVFLKDLLAIESGNPSTVDFEEEEAESTERVNWSKMEMIAENVHQIQSAQQDPFKFGPIDSIQELLSRKAAKEDKDDRFQILEDEATMHEISRQLEPSNRTGSNPEPVVSGSPGTKKDYKTMRIFGRGKARSHLADSKTPSASSGESPALSTNPSDDEISSSSDSDNNKQERQEEDK